MQSVAKWENLTIFIPALADGRYSSLLVQPAYLRMKKPFPHVVIRH